MEVVYKYIVRDNNTETIKTFVGTDIDSVNKQIDEFEEIMCHTYGFLGYTHIVVSHPLFKSVDEIMSLLPEWVGGCEFTRDTYDNSIEWPGYKYYRMGYASYDDSDDLCFFGGIDEVQVANDLYNRLVEEKYIK